MKNKNDICQVSFSTRVLNILDMERGAIKGWGADKLRDKSEF